MKRALFILLGAVTLGTAIFAGSYFVAQRTTKMCCAKPADDLSWMQEEYHLSDQAMAQIRGLQAGYLPKCADICRQIAAKKHELEAALGNGTNLTAEAHAKMAELAALRAQCQAQMLQHFINVSQVMPPEQGQRYLTEMKRLALGDNGQMEQSISGEMSHEHQP
jgi:hypothetical protein